MLKVSCLRLAVVFIVTVGLGACTEPPIPTVALPAGLALDALPDAQQELLRATVAVSDGALAETEVAIDIDAGTVAGAFTLQNVTAPVDRIFTLRVSGRFSADSDEVVLGEHAQVVTLSPGGDAAIDLAGATFDTCRGVDGRCASPFDDNRNGVGNIDDLLPVGAGGRGIDPAAQPPFLSTSASQLQFPSGVRPGTFARQLVVLENLGAHDVVIESAAVVGGQGFSLSLLDATGSSVQTPTRSLSAQAFAPINPGEETFIAVSFSPVNAFVATGTFFVVATDVVTGVRQTARVKLIANPDGGLRPADPAAVEARVTDDAITVGGVVVPTFPFPVAPLFSGEPVTGDDVPTGGVPAVGARLAIEHRGAAAVAPADLAFLVDITPGSRLAAAIDGLGSDIDLAIVAVDEAAGVSSFGALACPDCLSQNAGLSAEAAELRHAGQGSRRVAVVLGRADDDGRAVLPFRLVVTLSRGPEFNDDDPIDPGTGPQEGGVTITLRGTGFQDGATVTVGGAPATDVRVLPGDEVDVVTLTLPAQAGQENPASVVLVNPGVDEGGDGQAAALLEAFTFQPPAPVVLDVTPDLAVTGGGGAPLTVNGRFFSGRHGPPRVVFRDPASGDDVDLDAELIDAATLRVVPPPSPSGDRAIVAQLRVQNRVAPDVAGTPVLGAASNAVSFRFVVADGPAPTAGAIAPATSGVDGGDAFTLTGTGFRAGAQVFIDGRAAVCSAPRDGGVAIDCVTPVLAGAGVFDVLLVNADGQQALFARSLTAAVPAPAITSLFPSSVRDAGGTLVVVAGSGFRGDVEATVEVGDARFAAAASRVSATTILVTMPALPVGAATLAITTGVDQRVTASFTVFSVVGAPTPPAIARVAPVSGDVAGGYEVVIEGQDFRFPRVVFGGVVIVDAAFVDAAPPALDRLTFTAPPSPTGGEAAIDVQVTNADDSSSAGASFSYVAAPRLAPRIDAVLPTTLLANTSTTVSIVGARFDVLGARALVRGIAVPVIARSLTRLDVVIDTTGLPLGPSLLVVENGDGQSATTSITVEALPPPPSLTSLSTTTVHARVPGDALVVIGARLDQGDVTAAFRPVAGGPVVPARVLNRDAATVLLEVPTLVPGAHVVDLTFTGLPASAVPLTLTSTPIAARPPLVGSVAAVDRGLVDELTITGDALNASALISVEVIDLGGRVLPCTLGATGESLVRCTTTLAPGTAYRPRLTWNGRENGAVVVVVLDAVALGALDGFGGDPLDNGTVTLVANTDFAVIEGVADALIPGLDPAALPAALDVEVIDPDGEVLARGLAAPIADGAEVLLDDGILLDLAADIADPLTLRLAVGPDLVATGEVTLARRGVDSAGFVGQVTWPLAVQPVSGSFIAGDVARIIALHPSEPLTRDVAPVQVASTFRLNTTRALTPGPWQICLSDQLPLEAPLDLCAPLTVNQRGTELEPNGTDATATAMTLNAPLTTTPITIAGSLGVGDDDRFFALATSDVTRVRATLAGTCSAGTVTRLRARDSLVVLDESTSTGTCPILEADLTPRSEFVVELSGASATSSYNVRLDPLFCGDNDIHRAEQCDDGPFTGLDCQLPACSEPGEPDDVVRRPVELTDNVFRTLTAGDVDRYVVTLPTEDNFGAGLVLRNGRTSITTCAARLRITLRNEAGDVVSTDVTRAPTDCPFVDGVIPAGTYLIDVEATNPADVVRYRLFTFLP